ncbi:uncharacterized protein LOC129876889 [Solanum dulcamara]|uniref:uncharacterized protein LOC129876889 n=1 Tax=Solanum dulcamara TaxID=45834 RepID=UPI0024858C75|nr:uncharacterized protein LOC129876889 [Solanum dulcamara]
MALKFNSFPFTMFLILVISSTVLHISSAKFEDPINPDDSKVIDIAKFAVNEFNKKSKHNYELKEVDGGRSSVIPDVKDAKDPKVVEIAKSALNEFNKKAKHNYELEEVDGGRTTSVTDGINYQLDIVVNE